MGILYEQSIWIQQYTHTTFLSAHTATTLIPILACHCDNASASLLEKVMVISIYLPYLIFPLWMVYICFVSHDVFGKKEKKKQ